MIKNSYRFHCFISSRRIDTTWPTRVFTWPWPDDKFWHDFSMSSCMRFDTSRQQKHCCVQFMSIWFSVQKQMRKRTFFFQKWPLWPFLTSGRANSSRLLQNDSNVALKYAWDLSISSMGGSSHARFTTSTRPTLHGVFDNGVWIFSFEFVFFVWLVEICRRQKRSALYDQSCLVSIVNFVRTPRHAYLGILSTLCHHG